MDILVLLSGCVTGWHRTATAVHGRPIWKPSSESGDEMRACFAVACGLPGPSHERAHVHACLSRPGLNKHGGLAVSLMSCGKDVQRVYGVWPVVGASGQPGAEAVRTTLIGME